MKSLPQSWFERPTLKVAADLMGQHLCRRTDSGQIIRTRITEVEAYDGPEDKACHAYKGKTPRNEIMFEPGGCWYVYLCYGVHWMLNVTAGPKNFPAAVLIRGTEHASGPGRLTKALNIDSRFKGKSAVPTNDLWIEEGDPFPSSQVIRTPRIGIAYAKEWIDKPYRWHFVPDNKSKKIIHEKIPRKNKYKVQ
eukprot:CFRG2087T1